MGLSVEAHDAGLVVLGMEEVELRDHLGRQSLGALSATMVAEHVESLWSGKFDEYVDESLLRALWASRNSDYVDQAIKLMTDTVESHHEIRSFGR